MSETRIDTVINAPPEACFAVFSDLETLDTRISAISKVEILTQGPMALGTRWRETRTMFGREATEEMTISEFDPPRAYAATAASHGAEYYSRFDFAAEGDGTRVTMTFRSKPVSLVAKVMGWFLAGAMAKTIVKSVTADMEDLKRAIEGTTT